MHIRTHYIFSLCMVLLKQIKQFDLSQEGKRRCSQIIILISSDVSAIISDCEAFLSVEDFFFFQMRDHHGYWLYVSISPSNGQFKFSHTSFITEHLSFRSIFFKSMEKDKIAKRPEWSLKFSSLHVSNEVSFPSFAFKWYGS